MWLRGLASSTVARLAVYSLDVLCLFCPDATEAAPSIHLIPVGLSVCPCTPVRPSVRLSAIRQFTCLYLCLSVFMQACFRTYNCLSVFSRPHIPLLLLRLVHLCVCQSIQPTPFLPLFIHLSVFLDTWLRLGSEAASSWRTAEAWLSVPSVSSLMKVCCDRPPPASGSSSTIDSPSSTNRGRRRWRPVCCQRARHSFPAISSQCHGFATVGARFGRTY
jgi:hypothetical protein